MTDDDKPDMLEVLQHYDWGPLNEGPGWRSIRCKVHDERRASARVNYELGRIRCFACDFSGDAYDVIKYEEGCDFATAKRIGEEVFGASGGPLRSQHGGQSGRGVPGGARYRTTSRGYVPPRLRSRT